jgi:hypothetical protein
MEENLRSWLENRWLCWGVGPVLAANTGFFSTMVALEVCIALRFMPQSAFITYAYGKESDKNRSDFIEGTQMRIPFLTQLRFCFWTMLGPTAILNGLLNALIADYLFPFTEGDPLYPALWLFVLQVVCLLPAACLLLYALFPAACFFLPAPLLSFPTLPISHSPTLLPLPWWSAGGVSAGGGGLRAVLGSPRAAR